MNKYTLLGLASWGVSLLLVGFQGLSMLLGKSGGWDAIRLADWMAPDHLAWVKDVPEGMIQNSVELLIGMPVYLFLFGLGMICFVLNAVFARH